MTTWLFAICLRVAAAHRRRAHLHHELSTAELDDRPDERTPSDPEAAAQRTESVSRLAQALDALSPEKRSALVMFEIEGIAATEIAEMLGVPVGTVYSRLSAARVEFQAAVKRLDSRTNLRGAR
jgi:RNA polymerase sigma-70 factor (ECF subfamily)